jgi:hypothetical protein
MSSFVLPGMWDIDKNEDLKFSQQMDDLENRENSVRNSKTFQASWLIER